MWVVVALVAEGLLWPAERTLQQVVAAREAGGPGADRESGAGDVDAAGLCLRSGLLGLASGVALVGVAVLMVAKP